jgi:hypothetical protein
MNWKSNSRKPKSRKKKTSLLNELEGVVNPFR